MHAAPDIHWKLTARRVLRFGWHVLQRFHHHRGLLLSGAVAYNVLLSIVPLGGLLLVSLSRLVDRDELVRVLSIELEHLLPGQQTGLIREVTGFLDHSELLGGISLLMLLFFGSVAFRVLGEAMRAIFADVRRVAPSVRGFLPSMAIPFLYVGFVGAGLIVLTLASSLVERVNDRSLTILGLELSFDAAQRWTLSIGGIVGELLLFTSIYRVLPGIKVRLRDAVTAGFVATALWELTRRLMVWYFANVSTIGLVYGSLATVVITLFSAELAAIILLLGAQVLAELTHAREDGIPWHAIAERYAGRR